MNNIISITNLSYTVPYSQMILADINLKLGAGEFAGILGHNGIGKTTLLDIILGIKKASKGSVDVLGENPHSPDRQRKNEIIFLSQDIALKGDLSIREFLRFHSSFYPAYSQEDENHLMNVFRIRYDQKIGSLSTGQQKKVQVIAGFAARPKLILVDEITAVMDPETRDIFFGELIKLKQRHSSAILLATNIAEDLVDRADKVLFIKDKKSTIHSPQDILDLFNVGQAA